MSGLNIELEGLAELQAQLESTFGNDMHQPVLEKGAEHFKEKLEETVYRYGLKRRTSISERSMAIQKAALKEEIIIGVSAKSTDAFYLYFHEWGTSKVRARPFMRPTFEREQQKIIDIMAEEMRVRLRL